MKLFLWFPILFITSKISAQEDIVIKQYQSFNTENGMQSSSVTSATIDSIGILYMNGINSFQKFDGSIFLDFKIDGINFSSRPTIYTSMENILYIIDRGKIIRTNKEEGKTTFLETQLSGDSYDFSFILNETKDELWIYFTSSEMYIFNKHTFKVTHRTSHEALKGRVFGQMPVQHSEHSILFLSKDGIIEILKQNNEIHFSQMVNQKEIIWNFIQINEHQKLYIAGNKLLKGDVSSKNSKQIAILGKTNHPLRTTITPITQHEFLISFDNSIFIYNDHNETLSKLVKDSKGNNFFRNGPITFTLLDKYKNLYIFSLAEGFVKMAKPIGLIQSISSDDNTNFVASLFYDSTEHVLISGNLRTGIKIFDQNFHPVYKSNFSHTPICIWKNQQNEYYYTVIESNEVFYLRKKDRLYHSGVVSKNLYISSYYTNSVEESENDMLKINGQFIEKVKKGKDSKGVSESIHVSDKLSFFSSLNDKNIYLGGLNEVVILDSHYKILKTYPLKERGIIRKLLRKNENEIYVGSDIGLELYDNDMRLIKTYYKGTIFSIVATEEGRIWCGTNKGLICLHNENIIYFNKGDGLSCEEYNGNCALYTKDKNLIFGGIGGIDIFNERSMLDNCIDPDCILSDIIINDQYSFESFWNAGTLILPYNKSFINFKMAPLGLGNINSYLVQYKLKGINETWINGLQNRSVNYQLPSGSYEFQYTAAKFFSQNPSHYKTLKIKVLPIFYKSWWFILMSSVLIAGLVYYIFSLINRIKFEKQKAEWQIQTKLLQQKSEFSKELHDLIGSQIGIVSRNIDYILEEAKNMPEDKIQDMLTQTVGLSKQIAKDVRDTIWASNKESISIEDFILRVKDHTYFYKYLPLDIKVESELKSTNIMLQPTEALNLLRIIQEAMHNAEKHSHSKEVLISITQSDSIQIHIIDYGIGISNEIISTGYGIDNMKSRAAKINYHLEFAPEKIGTHLILTKNG